MSSADLIAISTVTTLKRLELPITSRVGAQTMSEAAAGDARAAMVRIRSNGHQMHLEQAHHGIIFVDHVTNTVMSWPSPLAFDA